MARRNRIKLTTCNTELHRVFKELQIVTQSVIDTNMVKEIQLNRILNSLNTNGQRIEAVIVGDKILLKRYGAPNYEIYLSR
jgi:hypothetical protein